ncbi:MAG: MCE family protein [Rhodococcus sp. (in: high G+C Gram-positive bacteria)]|uniref:MCE family protein n=1 Tax=Rhodococcus sp. TaxID=1831 RepID=UPI003BB18A39
MTSKAPGFKLIIFMLVTTVTTALLATVVGNMRFGPSRSYSAIFVNASGLVPGEEVKVAGVPIGKVEAVRLRGTTESIVEFTVSEDRPLLSGTVAAVKYKNLIGDRYLELTNGPGEMTPLSEEEPIPSDRTQPALDLDELVNGFKPLLQGLDPEQTNRLSVALIEVLNGQTETIGLLVQEIATLTNTLADRDQVIGRLISNLDAVLATVDARADQFSKIVQQIQSLIGGLSADREMITGSLVDIDNASATMAGLLGDTRPSIQQDITELGSLSRNLNSSTDTLNFAMGELPQFYKRMGRVAYGNFVNFYVCGLAIRYPAVSGHADTPMFISPVERCQ